MAKRKINWKSKNLWKNVLAIGLAVITCVGVIAGISAIVKKSEETTKKINPTYAVGGLTEQGTFSDTKESIYTKDAFECYGLKTSLAFDNNISYRLYFYDKDSSFIESTSKLTTNFNSEETEMPAGTKYCRIVITPDDDDKISWYEKSSYSKQLTIEVNKDQSKSHGVSMPWSANLFEFDSTLTGKMFNGTFTNYSENTSFNCSKIVDTSDYTEVKISANNLVSNSAGILHFANSNKTIVSTLNLTTSSSNYVGDNTWVISIPKNCAFVGVSAYSSLTYTMVCR